MKLQSYPACPGVTVLKNVLVEIAARSWPAPESKEMHACQSVRSSHKGRPPLKNDFPASGRTFAGYMMLPCFQKVNSWGVLALGSPE